MRLLTPLRKRILKRKFRKFWDEWGISKEEALMFLGAAGIILNLILLNIVLALLG